LKLRHWQSECVDCVLDHYALIDTHFLCLATPGAGKTVMAAEVAARLFDKQDIDFVLCFSPSITIAEGFKRTFSKHLERRFDGLIGAAGCSYTYQSLPYFNQDFWQLLLNHRVLVIFDEIHHCSGQTLEDSNAWGQEIILNIKTLAAYTMALTGTPWRSDKSPIVLSQYTGTENLIHCDYTYGLQKAIEDGVCKTPSIVLIDNEKISVSDNQKEIQIFDSLKSLLGEKVVSYQDIVTNKKAIRFVLERGCSKLAEIRQTVPNAGGLVVASSVEHANNILDMLVNEFNQSAVVVSYQHDSPSAVIDNFRTNLTQWIVAIGMVSEGTDIPRLQVCCHLSRIKTELYFRQVLGRILRINGKQHQNAWLYTFSETKLSEYAHRISEDLPEIPVIIREFIELNDVHSDIHLEPKHNNDSLDIGFSYNSSFDTHELPYQLGFNNSSTMDNVEPTTRCFELLGLFREQVVATFNSPFQ